METVPCHVLVSLDAPFERGVVRYNEACQQGVGGNHFGHCNEGICSLQVFKGVCL